MTITGLTPATQYHFRIKADDGGGNVGYSGDNVLRTSPASQASTLLMRDKVGGYWSGAIFELWTMSTNGTRTQLTQTGVGYKDFQWSADGTKIVCAAPDCVVMMNADGSSVRTVITVPDVYNNRGNYIIFSPSLTPDQQWIYCVYESGDFCGIYKVKSDGAQLTRLSKYNDYTLEGLRVSPDGAKLLYVSGKTGHKQIYLANLDLTGEVNLSNSSGDDLTPAFSPDMTGIVFASSRDGNWEVYKMNLDGNTVVRLTNTSNGTESNPVWGNDGRIYFNKSTYENWGSLWATLNLVYAMNADGSNVIRISNPADYHKNTSDGSDDMYEEKCELAVPALPLAGSFAIEGVTAPGPGRAMSMSWAGATGRLYSVLFTRDLVTGAWSNVPDSGYLNMPGQNGPMSYTNTADLGSNAFFRVRSSW
jgi:Tol biopolymer transport system component